MPHHRVPAMSAALVLLVAACGVGGSADNPATTTTPQSVVSTTVVVVTTTGAGAALSDGDHFVFLRDLDESSLSIDPAEMLSGEEAREAAVEDGVLEEGEDLPNDFYIRNSDRSELIIPIDEDAVVTLIASGPNGLSDIDLDLPGLLAAWRGESSEIIYGLTPEFFPVVVTVTDGVVTAARQQYVP